MKKNNSNSQCQNSAYDQKPTSEKSNLYSNFPWIHNGWRCESNFHFKISENSRLKNVCFVALRRNSIEP